MTKTTKPLLVVCSALLLAAACDDDSDNPSVDAGTPLYGVVVEKQELTVGGGTPVLAKFGQGGLIELDIPANVSATAVRIQVSLVTGTVMRGQSPVNSAGLLVQPAGLVFVVPVTVRQPVNTPAVGKTYAPVVLEEDKPELGFVVRGPLGVRSTVERQGVPAGQEIWEGQGDGSGLWGFALVDDPNVNVKTDAGPVDAAPPLDDGKFDAAPAVGEEDAATGTQPRHDSGAAGDGVGGDGAAPIR